MSFSWQSANFPGRLYLSNNPFLLVNSLAFLAASLALAALTILNKIFLPTAGFSSKKVPKASFVKESTMPLTSEFPNFVFVCPSN